jgi:hypothetical protein
MSDSLPGEFIESSVTGTRDSRNNATASGLGFSSSGLLSEDDVFIKREGSCRSGLGSDQGCSLVDHSSGLYSNNNTARTKRMMKKRYRCRCGHEFSRLGHYNAHLRAVHMKYVVSLEHANI